MTSVANLQTPNGLLAALSPYDRSLLAPHLREVILFPRDLLHRPGEKIEQVYFLQSGIVSLMAVLKGMSVMAHVQQITACNALHDLTSRLSRILLLSADRCADDIQLSQESLAEMLGVRRSSVTTAAAILRGAGAIDYRRAVIKILDREKLRNMVCECYSTIRHTIDVGFNTHLR
jgi:hypothetical protein